MRGWQWRGGGGGVVCFWRPHALAHMTGAAGPVCGNHSRMVPVVGGGGGQPLHGLLGPRRGPGGGASRDGDKLAGSVLAGGPRDGRLGRWHRAPGALRLQAPAKEQRDGRRCSRLFNATADGPSMSGERGTETTPASATGEAVPGEGDSVVGSWVDGGRGDVVPCLRARKFSRVGSCPV